MSLRDKPYLPLYIQDFMTDEKLAQCSAKATGVYIRLMCLMHKSDQYGKILLKQKFKQTNDRIKNFSAQIVKHMPYDFHTVTESLVELLEEKVLTMEGDILIQKRMVEDNAISEARAAAGKKGGLSTTSKTKEFAKANAQAKAEANTDNDIEGENDFLEKERQKEKTFLEPDMDVDLLVEKVILDKRYREQCEIAGYPPAKLVQWMYAFNRFLKFKGVDRSSESGWRLGFPAWMAYHNYRNGEDPDHYSPVIWARKKIEDADKILKQNGTNKTNSNSSATTRSVEALLSGLDAGPADSEDLDG